MLLVHLGVYVFSVGWVGDINVPLCSHNGRKLMWLRNDHISKTEAMGSPSAPPSPGGNVD